MVAYAVTMFAFALGTTSTVTESRTVFYPDVNFRPSTRARSVDGHDVRWDQPVVHNAVNRPSNSRWGVPDVLAALPASQVLRTVPRGGTAGAAPAITAANVPAIAATPSAADAIAFSGTTVTIPD